MSAGNPIAFYQLAATLIPVLFLGGILIERLRRPPDLSPDIDVPEDFGGISKGELADYLADWINAMAGTHKGFLRLTARLAFSKRNRAFLMGVACLLPIAAAYVVFAEILAIDAVVSRSADSLHAWVVSTTMVAGVIVVILALCIPWLGKVLGRLSGFGKVWILAPAAFVAASIAAVIVASLVAGPHITSATTHPLSADERVWLEHLVATSDFRIDKLESEEAATGQENPHIHTQIVIQERQCEDLEGRITAAESTDAFVPPPCLPK